jgi:voltage-gated potassium channel
LQKTLDSIVNSVKIRTALATLFFIILGGIAGYMIIEGDDFFDALYMTVITVSTVGFSETHELTTPGRLFTIFLIVTSFGTYAYAISVITTHFVEGKLSMFIRGYSYKKHKKMENHIIICGFGRNGQQAAQELKAYEAKFVVIDSNSQVIEKNLGNNIRIVEGDSTQDEILIKADISKAKSLITTLPNDADNLYVVITARALNPSLNIISRASDENSEKKLRMAGVDSVVMPEKVGGAQMAKLVTRPDLLEFLNHLSIRHDAPTNLEEIICSDLPKEYLNITIANSKIRTLSGANIVGMKTAEGDYIINPDPESKILPSSKLFVLGTTAQTTIVKNILKEAFCDPKLES